MHYETTENGTTKKVYDSPEEERFNKLLGHIFYICGLAGFHVEGRIKLKDKKTGRIWE